MEAHVVTIDVYEALSVVGCVAGVFGIMVILTIVLLWLEIPGEWD